MVLSLLPMLQFGSMHGTTILLPKYIAKNKNNGEVLFVYNNYLSHFLQLISLIVLLFIDLKLSNLLLIVIGTQFFQSLYIQNSMMYLNSKLEFEKANAIKSINEILRPIFILWLVYHLKKIDGVFYGQLVSTSIPFSESFYII